MMFCNIVHAKALGDADLRPVGEVTFVKQVTDPTVVLNWVASAVEGRAAGHASKLKSKSGSLFFRKGRHKVLRRPSGGCLGPFRGGPPFALAPGFLAPTFVLTFYVWAWLEWSINVDLIFVVVPCRSVVSRRNSGVGSNCAVDGVLFFLCIGRGRSSVCEFFGEWQGQQKEAAATGLGPLSDAVTVWCAGPMSRR